MSNTATVSPRRVADIPVVSLAPTSEPAGTSFATAAGEGEPGLSLASLPSPAQEISALQDRRRQLAYAAANAATAAERRQAGAELDDVERTIQAFHRAAERRELAAEEARRLAAAVETARAEQQRRQDEARHAELVTKLDGAYQEIQRSVDSLVIAINLAKTLDGERSNLAGSLGWHRGRPAKQRIVDYLFWKLSLAAGLWPDIPLAPVSARVPLISP